MKLLRRAAWPIAVALAFTAGASFVVPRIAPVADSAPLVGGAYLCQVTVAADGTIDQHCVPAPSGSPSGTPPPSPTATPTATPTVVPPSPSTGSTVALRAVDGLGFYGQFSNPLPSDASFFPIGVWFESVLSPSDVQLDQAAGLNTYVQLTANSDTSLALAAGMHVIAYDPPGARNGWTWDDEIDMKKGPAGLALAKSEVAAFPQDGTVRWINYGKGVEFWESDADAAAYVRIVDPTTGKPPILSEDNYWLTDNAQCSSAQGGKFYGGITLSQALCHLPANYGKSIDRIRSLQSPGLASTKPVPVWGFVELGRPWSATNDPSVNTWPAATPAGVRAAVWSLLIHGARGIEYFNHSFSGPCQTQHLLRDSCGDYPAMRAAVTALDAQVTALAPVLNAPYADGAFTVTGPVDAAVKWSGGHLYVLAGANTPTGGTGTFSAPCVGSATVTVLGENRTLPMVGGQFSDSFADGNAVHLYRVDGGSSCGLS